MKILPRPRYLVNNSNSNFTKQIHNGTRFVLFTLAVFTCEYTRDLTVYKLKFNLVTYFDREQYALVCGGLIENRVFVLFLNTFFFSLRLSENITHKLIFTIGAYYDNAITWLESLEQRSHSSEVKI